jgi:mRNA interferase MazF
MDIGDIYWAEIPFRGGREQAGLRPVIITQDADYGGNLPTVLVIPLTGNLLATRFAGTMLIQPNSENGLTQPSVALVFQIGALDRRRIRDRIGMLTPEVWNELLSLVDRLLGRI